MHRFIRTFTAKAKWTDIQRLHRNPPLTSVFTRSAVVAHQYDQHRAQVKSMKDYIVTKHFCNQNFLKGYALVLNDFPYEIDDSIEHWLIWIHPKKLSSEEIIGIIEYEMIKRGHHYYAYFQNEPHMRSIHTLDHWHIFIRK